MLRRLENARVFHDAHFIFFNRGWVRLQTGKTARGCGKGMINRQRYRAMEQDQALRPVILDKRGDRQFWWFQDRVYSDSEDLTSDEVHALLVTRQMRKRQQIDRAQEIVAMDEMPAPSLRGVIPDDLKQLVWIRDGGRCRQCGSQTELQFDHIIPVALGGATSAENLQVLCGPCNRRKGASVVSPTVPPL